MPEWVPWIVLLVLGYLVGSLPFGILVCRAWKAPDPRLVGSGNIGATNAARTAGYPAGVLVLLLDAAKGMGPTSLALGWLPAWGAALVGLACFCGHCWPIYLGFKGGKGVATALGVYLALSPWALLFTVLLLGATLGITGHMSLGSMAGCLSAPVWTALLGEPWSVTAVAVVLAGLVVLRHKDNINRLRQGQELRWRS